MSGNGRAAIALSLGVAATMVLAGFTATTASANTTPLGSTQIAETSGTWSTCTNPTIVNPFTKFSDKADYVLAPGGDFESTAPAGWQFSGGASVVAGGDPFNFTGAGSDNHSLGLSPRASVISPAMCIDLNYPHAKFTATAQNKDSAEILFEVVYPNAPNPAWQEIKKFDGKQGTNVSKQWRISDQLELKPDLGGSSAGPRFVAVRITALSGTWRVNDLYIDPKRR